MAELLCKCHHPESDHSETNDGSCVYGWDEAQALDDEERKADACPCERYVEPFAALRDAGKEPDHE